MRILWDFRLFSYGYRDRGVGRYVSALAKAAFEAGLKADVIAWADKNEVPQELAALPAEWIPYRKGSWKADLVRVPALVKMCGATVLHYWVAMGPITGIGMGMSHPCKTCMTVHDLGVEYNKNEPFMEHVNATWYWKTQKQLIGQADVILCNSQKTKAEIIDCFGGKIRRCEVLYPPMACRPPANEKRGTVFVTLGGEPHKNLALVIRAFSLFAKSHGEYTLAVCGAYEKGDIPPGCSSLPVFEDMDKYEQYLDTAAGLVFCSTYEGLGMPPLEALAHGCPVVASDIPALRETCGTAARFVDPSDAASIAKGLEDVADNREAWQSNSMQGFHHYTAMSADTGKQLTALYHSMMDQ
jgi:glycosyltransferase involved in cell wall biosynthesis